MLGGSRGARGAGQKCCVFLLSAFYVSNSLKHQPRLTLPGKSVIDQKGSSVTLSSATAASKLMSDGSDSSATFLSSTVGTGSGSNTTFRGISGTDGQNHKVTVSATCSDGNVLQADLIVEVRDL